MRFTGPTSEQQSREKIWSQDHLATAELDAYYCSEDYRSPTPLQLADETRNDRRTEHSPNTLVPYFRKKITYKVVHSTAGVFSSETTSRPISVRGPADTSGRRPLHFIAPLDQHFRLSLADDSAPAQAPHRTVWLKRLVVKLRAPV